MRHALLAGWLALAAVAIVTSTNCSVSHPSDGFACDNGQKCAPGRECVDGFCVVPGGATPDAGSGTPIDAPKGSNHPDAPENVCPTNCTSCDQGSHTCTIDCTQTNCNAPISCPLGWNCTIDCSTTSSCTKGISCANAASCTINCSGDGSCRGVACGTGPCDVTCSGQSSCRNVGCDNSCRCDVECDPGSSCENVTCVSFQCEAPIAGCTSLGAAICDTCPM